MNKTHCEKLNLVGRRFGNGIIVEQSEKPEHLKRGGRYWLVQCDCGNKRIVDGNTLNRGRWKSCGCLQERDLTGQTFGIGTVIGLLKERLLRSGKTNRLWSLQCQCGRKYKSTTNSLLWHNNKSCGCLNNRTGKNHPHYKGFEDLSGDYWCKLKGRARRRGIEFSITMEYAWKLFLNQKKRCALTGWAIKLDRWNKITASLDRIDSSKGYIEGNIQWLHKDVNKMKLHYDMDYFVSVCKAITERCKNET